MLLTLENGTVVKLEDVSVDRPGQVFAFVMDSRPCDNALILAKDADMVIMEATYTDTEVQQAHEYMHMTARQAATIARDAGAKELILTHFSQRYLNLSEHQRQAREIFPNTHVAHDLDHFEFPKRTRQKGL